MREETVLIRWIDPTKSYGLSLPTYETELSAGMDVRACVDEPLSLEPRAIVLVSTNLAVAIPEGFEIQVRPRSGLAIKKGITLINSPGTIDADYRGEIKIGLINLGNDEFVISRGDRIAQLILAPVARARFELVEKLDATERGSGGFGHTGV